MRAALDVQPDAAALREILKAVRDPAFASELTSFLRGVNDPTTKAEILNDLNEIAMHSSTMAALRQNEVTNTRYGIGVGGGFACSGVLAMVVSPFLAAAVFAGGWIAVTCALRTRSLREEEQLYQDIATRSTKILEKFDESQ